jgi:hypothetical protein
LRPNLCETPQPPTVIFPPAAAALPAANSPLLLLLLLLCLLLLPLLPRPRPAKRPPQVNHALKKTQKAAAVAETRAVLQAKAASSSSRKGGVNLARSLFGPAALVVYGVCVVISFVAAFAATTPEDRNLAGCGILWSCKNGEQPEWTEPDGTKYVGEWVNDRKSGKGVQTRADGTVYTGDWANNAPNGHGKFIDPTGHEWEGEWKNGQPVTAPGVQAIPKPPASKLAEEAKEAGESEAPASDDADDNESED